MFTQNELKKRHMDSYYSWNISLPLYYTNNIYADEEPKFVQDKEMYYNALKKHVSAIRHKPNEPYLTERECDEYHADNIEQIRKAYDKIVTINSREVIMQGDMLQMLLEDTNLSSTEEKIGRIAWLCMRLERDDIEKHISLTLEQSSPPSPNHKRPTLDESGDENIDIDPLMLWMLIQ